MVSLWPKTKGMDLLSLMTFVLLLLMPASISSSQYLGNNNLFMNRKILLPKLQEEEVTTSYAVIFDAGSTGSRIHVYHFDQNLDLLHIGNELEFYDSIKPGLSSYADNPEEAAESLIPLLEEAESVVPVSQQPNTLVKLGATAGLRLLNGDAAEKILQAVRDMLSNRSAFNVQSDAVAIIDGTQEGSYLWVTINYLLGKLGKAFTKTVGVIDLGGGSVQMTYAVSENTAEYAPKVPEGEDPYIKKLVLKGKNYDLYVHSYLRYGREAFRAEIFKVAGGSANPCILAGVDVTYTYSGEEYKVSGPASGSNLNKCRKIALKALKVNAPCPYQNCTFGGIWNGGGGSGQKNLFVTSSFYYLSENVGIIVNKSNAKIRPVDFKNAAKLVCKTNLEDAKSNYPKLVEQKTVEYACLDLVYAYTLLVDGFGLDPFQEITAAKDIEYQDALVDAAWPLGNAIEAISALPKFERLMYFI